MTGYEIGGDDHDQYARGNVSRAVLALETLSWIREKDRFSDWHCISYECHHCDHQQI